MTTAVFAGSFNPFTRGHLDILARGLRLFDRVILMLGINIHKPGEAKAVRKRADELTTLLSPLGEKVEVTLCQNLTAAAARELGACALLRGVRSAADYDYERSMAATNRMIAGIDTVILLANPRLEAVSSSVVRELESFGFDTSDLLPSHEEIESLAMELQN